MMQHPRFLEAVLRRKMLTCIGLPARPPPVAPAREEEQGELGLGG